MPWIDTCCMYSSVRSNHCDFLFSFIHWLLVPPKEEQQRLQAKAAATRRIIQHEYLHLLQAKGFKFGHNEKEPYGVKKEVLKVVNSRGYGPTRTNISRQTVYNWCKRVKDNGYMTTSCVQNYTQSSQNGRKFFHAEQKRIRDFIREEKLKCTDIACVYSDKEKKLISVSTESARIYMKMPLGDEPSHVAAKPKGYRVGGKTAHHNKCRYIEACFWKGQPQDVIDGMWFADESKMRFREHHNKQIDIEWCFRGDASETNWYEQPRHSTQVNLFLVQSRNGVMLFDIYDYNMTKQKYKETLPMIRDAIDENGEELSYYMHDNAWKGARPVTALDEYIGVGKWTQYMGEPCKRAHESMLTPTGRPAKVPKKRCGCEFPAGPIHAAYNPKLNLVEETFAEIDRQLLRNKRSDAVKGISWLVLKTKRKAFWKRQLRKAIKQVSKDKEFFQNQYDGYHTRCTAFIKSRGKRLKTSKW